MPTLKKMLSLKNTPFFLLCFPELEKVLEDPLLDFLFSLFLSLHNGTYETKKITIATDTNHLSLSGAELSQFTQKKTLCFFKTLPTNIISIDLSSSGLQAPRKMQHVDKLFIKIIYSLLSIYIKAIPLYKQLKGYSNLAFGYLFASFIISLFSHDFNKKDNSLHYQIYKTSLDYFVLEVCLYMIQKLSQQYVGLNFNEKKTVADNVKNTYSEVLNKTKSCMRFFDLSPATYIEKIISVTPKSVTHIALDSLSINSISSSFHIATILHRYNKEFTTTPHNIHHEKIKHYLTKLKSKEVELIFNHFYPRHEIKPAEENVALFLGLEIESPQ